ncbi:hypothetical protein Tco_1485853 [Tanacetum coccineum]
MWNPITLLQYSGDEHLSTIPEKKESSVEDLVQSQVSPRVFPTVCVMCLFVKILTLLTALKDHFEIFFDPNDDYASTVMTRSSLPVEDIEFCPAPFPSVDSLGSDLVVSFSFETRNKIFDLGIFIEVQSKKFLSPDELSISFIRDSLSSVFETLLLFSSENEKKVFNPGSLSSNEEKSPHLLSHRGFNPSKIIFDFSESPMMISGGDIPILDVPFLHFYPP